MSFCLKSFLWTFRLFGDIRDKFDNSHQVEMLTLNSLSFHILLGFIKENFLTYFNSESLQNDQTEIINGVTIPF